MNRFGYIPSGITDKTVRFQYKKSIQIPEKYSYVPFLSPVTDQGEKPYCIPHSVSVWLNWKENIKTGTKSDNNIRYMDIYESKKVQGEGMTYQDAFAYLEKTGVKSDRGIMKINTAGIVSNITALKAALLANGPCFGALPVYNQNSESFWKKTKISPEGWHSITIVGWNEKGYIIRNSWGTSFGDKGYTIIPYDDAVNFREIWTIID